MSKSIESQVWRSALDCELKPLAAVMADMGNDDGLGIYPSVEYLGWLVGRDRRTIQRQLQKLVDMGILSRISGASGGRARTPRYGLDVDALPKRPTWKELKKGGMVTPFTKGGISAQKGGINDTKSALKGGMVPPDPLVLDPLVTVSAPLAPPASPENPSGFEFNQPRSAAIAAGRSPRHRRVVELPSTVPDQMPITETLRAWLDGKGWDDAALADAVETWRLKRKASGVKHTLEQWVADLMGFLKTYREMRAGGRR